MHQRIAPADDFDRADIFADEVAGDLDAVAAEVDDRAAAGEFLVPEPVAVRAGMRFARADPEHFADACRGGRTPGRGASWACSKGLRGSRGKRRPARRLPASAATRPRCGRAAWCKARPCRLRRRRSRPLRAGDSAGRRSTTSVSASRIASCRFVVCFGMPHFSANSCAARPTASR